MSRSLWAFIFIFGPALANLQIGQDDSTDGRIIGGTNAEDGQYPYQASIHLRLWRSQHICGGSIISSRWILSAAHCTLELGPRSFVIHVGTNLASGARGSFYKVIQINIHEKYNTSKYTNDIALFKTDRDIAFNNKIKPVHLASTYPPSGSSCILSGWGYIKLGGPPSDYLQYINLKMENCKWLGSVVSDNQICTASLPGRGACNGDSGSPLVCNDVQYGVASFVIRDCDAGYPDVYTSVASYRKWITEKTGV